MAVRRGAEQRSQVAPGHPDLWDGAYPISLTDGIWVARRRDNPTRILTADTAPELRWLLRADYGQWLRTGT